MIRKIVPLQVFVQKIIVFIFILCFTGYNLFFYHENQEQIKSFKPYYAKAYAYAFENRFFAINASADSAEQVMSATSVPVLVYHGIENRASGSSQSLYNFKEQMFKLKKAGYQTVSLSDFNMFTKGEKTLPEKSFLITFDDGRKDSYYPVDPILQELNYTAVMFVITSTVEIKDHPFHLSKTELAKMKKSGRWDLEVHTFEGHGDIAINDKGDKGHFYTNKQWLANENRLETDEEFRLRIRNDLIHAQDDLKKFFDIDAIAFAFPYGDHGQEVNNFQAASVILEQEAKSIFSLLFYQTDTERGYSYNLFARKDKMIKRIDVSEKWNSEDLLTFLKKGQEKTYPLKLLAFEPIQGWIKTWGSIAFQDNQLILTGNDEARGGSAFLDGTSSLKNLKYSITVNQYSSNVISLLFRHKNDLNFLALNIEGKHVTLTKLIDGVQTIIKEADMAEDLPNGDKVISVSANNNQLTGTVNGLDVINALDNEPTLASGGVGLMILNRDDNDDKTFLKTLEIINY